MDFTRLSLDPVSRQMAAMVSKYQYRRRKTTRFSSGSFRRKALMAASMRRASSAFSTDSRPETLSPNSSRERTAQAFRFPAERYSQRFSARFLVIRLRKTENRSGRWVGMAFQTAR